MISSVVRGWRESGEEELQKGMRKLLGVTDLFTLLTMVMVSWVNKLTELDILNVQFIIAKYL